MKRAIIVGGSMAGLMAGNILLRCGWDVQVLERANERLEARGAGIATQKPLIAALARAGIDVSDDIGILTNHRVGYDASGAVVAEHAYQQVTTSWGLIYNLLLGALPTHLFKRGTNVTALTQNGDDATVYLEDGRELTADLIVAADGMRSTIRGCINPEIRPKYTGYVAWRGLLDERDMPPDVDASAFTSFNLGFVEGENLVGYPVAGSDGSIRAGCRRFNVMWYRPVRPGSELRNIMTGSDGRFYENGIPPNLIRSDVLDIVRDQAKALPPIFSKTVALMDRLFVQPIFDLDTDRIGMARVALVGDAAFVARPHCGAGVSKAAADVAALADALGKGHSVEAAVETYTAQRTPAGQKTVDWARYLGGYFQLDENGYRRADYAPSRPPISPAELVRYTGIEPTDDETVAF